MITVGKISTGSCDSQNGWSQYPNSAGGVSVKFSFRNDSGKTIKYITFSLKPYNSVNDFVESDLSSQNGRLRCTGPIEPDEIEKNCLWENCWYNSTIVGASLLSIYIIYMDGTEETIDSEDIVYDTNLGGGDGGCYVATCVYGSYDSPEVWTLRRYRDDTLGSTWYGRAFIKTYYAVSPTLVKWFGNTKWFKKMWKGKLDRMVNKLQAQGVKNTPYEDKEWRKHK